MTQITLRDLCSGPVLAVTGGSRTETDSWCGMKSCGCGRERDEFINPVQTSTLHPLSVLLLLACECSFTAEAFLFKLSYHSCSPISDDHTGSYSIPILLLHCLNLPVQLKYVAARQTKLAKKNADKSYQILPSHTTSFNMNGLHVMWIRKSG